MTDQTYQEKAISVNAAAKKYGIPQRTLADWVSKGRLRVLKYPERHGQAMLVDEASVLLAKQAYTPHWRGEGINLPLPLETPQNPDPPPAQPAVATYAPAATADLPQIDTAELVEKFEHFNRGLAKSTREGYHYRMMNFLGHFPILPLDWKQIQDYLDDLRDEDGKLFSDAHRHTCATLLRTFYNWAYRHHHIPRWIENPIDLVKFPPDGRKSKLPQTLTNEEVQRVIGKGKDFREQTMMRLLYTSGIRAGELRSLQPDMLYPPDSAIQVPTIRPSGKEGERVIYITKEIYEALKRLADLTPEGGYIFPDATGKMMAHWSLYHRVRRLMLKAGIKGKKLGPYRFRHTFVTDVVADSHDLALAQKLAGHAKISTTERYTHLGDAVIAEGFQKFTPQHRLKGENNGANSKEEAQVSRS